MYSPLLTARITDKKLGYFSHLYIKKFMCTKCTECSLYLLRWGSSMLKKVLWPCGYGHRHSGHIGGARVFNRLEFSGRHDFQAKKFGRPCTKPGSHAVGLQEKSSKNLMQNKTYYICVTNAPPT